MTQMCLVGNSHLAALQRIRIILSVKVTFFSLKLGAGITVHFLNFSDLYFLKAAITHVGTCEILFSVLVVWSIAISETLGEIIISGST